MTQALLFNLNVPDSFAKEILCFPIYYHHRRLFTNKRREAGLLCARNGILRASNLRLQLKKRRNSRKKYFVIPV